ncbi:hypothetical protein C7M84_013729 [Penaeus vannamei]|uniref:Uncharacterized protein n=1 Tax=Penaeus vannamei TaxID=6689 RepID=A0A3R7NVY1_PENVA|nr:hypothetical protein C7M84_013729 [Penaeus vannamei]
MTRTQLVEQIIGYLLTSTYDTRDTNKEEFTTTPGGACLRTSAGQKSQDEILLITSLRRLSLHICLRGGTSLDSLRRETNERRRKGFRDLEEDLNVDSLSRRHDLHAACPANTLSSMTAL